jgi:hypothetical protein
MFYIFPIMNFIEALLLIIIIGLIVYIAVTGGRDICKIAVIGGILCKCHKNVPNVSGSDPDGKCWSCPKINNAQTTRTANAVTASNACSAPCDQLYPGTQLNVWDGSCYKCPEGYYRSGDTDINAGDACVLTTCADKWPGSVWDTINGGGCWKCPSNLPCRNNLVAVNQPNACGGCTVGGPSAPATFMGSNKSKAIIPGNSLVPANLSSPTLF